MKKMFMNLTLIAAFTTGVLANANGWGHHPGGGGHRPSPPPHHGGHHRPVLRYPYRSLAWGALMSMYAYHRFSQPPQAMTWACFASSEGYYGQGFGYNPQEAQENAIYNCGPACMDRSYAMDCAPRY